MALKKFVFEIDEALIKRATLTARSENRTLDSAFRERIKSYARPRGNTKAVRRLMQSLKHVRSGGRFTRDEMNER